MFKSTRKHMFTLLPSAVWCISTTPLLFMWSPRCWRHSVGWRTKNSLSAYVTMWQPKLCVPDRIWFCWDTTYSFELSQYELLSWIPAQWKQVQNVLQVVHLSGQVSIKHLSTLVMTWCIWKPTDLRALF